MLVSQMFPSKTLDPRDLRAFNPGVTTVTIERIDFKTVEASDFGDAGIVYYIHTREFRKPFSLNRTKAQTIADVLGSDDTDHWIGRQIGIMYGTVSIPEGNGRRKQVPVINVDIQAPPPNSMDPRLNQGKMDLTGISIGAQLSAGMTSGMNPAMSQVYNNVGAPRAAIPTTATPAAPAKYTGAAALRLGPRNAEKFKMGLAEINATMDECLAWMKGNDWTAYEGCYGKMLEDWPAGAAVAMSRFLKEYNLKPALTTITTIPAPAPLPGTAGGDMGTQGVADDIPF